MRIDPFGTRSFSMSDLCEWTGATPPQVENWIRHQIIVPLQSAGGRGSHRVFSLENVIQARMALELGDDQYLGPSRLSVDQLAAIFGQLRETIRKARARPELHATLWFVKYIEMVDKLVEITGEGPNYRQWRRDVNALWSAHQQTPHALLDEPIVQWLSRERTAETDRRGKDAR